MEIRPFISKVSKAQVLQCMQQHKPRTCWQQALAVLEIFWVCECHRLRSEYTLCPVSQVPLCGAAPTAACELDHAHCHDMQDPPTLNMAVYGRHTIAALSNVCDCYFQGTLVASRSRLVAQSSRQGHRQDRLRNSGASWECMQKEEIAGSISSARSDDFLSCYERRCAFVPVEYSI